MMQFADQFPDKKIVSPLATQLTWTHFVRQKDENAPIGLILCTGGSREQIELLEMHEDGIIVAEYWTDLPPKKELEEKIHALLIEARERIEAGKLLE
jgi:hypothetical protein